MPDFSHDIVPLFDNIFLKIQLIEAGSRRTKVWQQYTMPSLDWELAVIDSIVKYYRLRIDDLSESRYAAKEDEN